jgi:hypothetical protein
MEKRDIIHALPRLTRQPITCRIKGIVKQHLDAFTTELSPGETTLLEKLPPEEANAMFVVWLCESLDSYRSMRVADTRRRIELGEHIAQLGQALDDADNERNFWRRLAHDKESENRSLRTAYMALLKDTDKSRRLDHGRKP